MSNNVFEEQVSEYLRYNGFFLVRDFVIHFEDAQACEIDFIGIRLPRSVEQTVYSDGRYSSFVFQDDSEKLGPNETPEMIFLIAEVTESTQDSKIKERIDKLKNLIRISYGLQRLGIIEEEYVDELMHGRSIHSEGVRARLVRILFVLNDRIVDKYEKENNITLISRGDVLSFIKSRAKIDIKARSRTLLPRWLHHFVDDLLQRMG